MEKEKIEELKREAFANYQQMAQKIKKINQERASKMEAVVERENSSKISGIREEINKLLK